MWSFTEEVPKDLVDEFTNVDPMNATVMKSATNADWADNCMAKSKAPFKVVAAET